MTATLALRFCSKMIVECEDNFVTSLSKKVNWSLVLVIENLESLFIIYINNITLHIHDNMSSRVLRDGSVRRELEIERKGVEANEMEIVID
jgi:hypothetical protein